MSIDDLVKTVMGELHTIVKTETVIGEPVQVGLGTVLIPVCKVSFGFGVGGRGLESTGGGGTGGGASVEPIAFVVIKDGKPQLLTFGEKKATLSKAIELLPDILSKVRDLRSKREAQTSESSETTQKGRKGK